MAEHPAGAPARLISGFRWKRPSERVRWSFQAGPTKRKSRSDHGRLVLFTGTFLITGCVRRVRRTRDRRIGGGRPLFPIDRVLLPEADTLCIGDPYALVVDRSLRRVFLHTEHLLRPAHVGFRRDGPAGAGLRTAGRGGRESFAGAPGSR